jgi:GT2 family glycosyltransferase/peptidoglycan/xylan/chitin deacetylase (PgdA/CDA1 family)
MKSAEGRIAVVMITHNRREEVLASLSRLTRLPENPQIVVVDNASRDGTCEAIAKRFPAVELIAAGGNLGAAARNLGVRHVQTPYVALCDDDTWWEAGALRRAADLFDAHPRLAVATARILVEPQHEDDPICGELQRSPLPREEGMPGPPLLGFMAGASVVRRSALLDAGGFEPRFFLGGEEELLALDLAAAGWWLCYVPRLLVYHRPSPRRDAVSRRWLLLRNALWSAWLRRPLFAAFRKSGQILRAAPSKRESWRGLSAALAGLPWVLWHRRVVPPHVERGIRLLETSPRGRAPQRISEIFHHRDLKGDDLPRGTVCLTYDDGPGADTLELGRYLFDEGIAATFFVVGSHAETQRHVLAQLQQWGHLIGNHTYSHPGLVSLALSGGDVVGELQKTDAIIRPYVSSTAILFRPPYGNWRERTPEGDADRDTSLVADLLNASGQFDDYIGPINWDIVAEDWACWREGVAPEECARRYLAETERVGGGILLMHDSSEDEDLRSRNRTMPMTKLLVPRLKERGYRFVRLDAVPSVRAALAATRTPMRKR